MIYIYTCVVAVAILWKALRIPQTLYFISFYFNGHRPEQRRHFIFSGSRPTPLLNLIFNIFSGRRPA